MFPAMKTCALDDLAAPPPAPSELVAEARRDEEGIVLTAGDQRVAKLVGVERVESASATEAERAMVPTRRPKAGCLPGIWMAPDFDEPLEDFKDYME